MKNIIFFFSENVQFFFVVKFSIYLDRCVFVMSGVECCLEAVELSPYTSVIVYFTFSCLKGSLRPDERIWK